MKKPLAEKDVKVIMFHVLQGLKHCHAFQVTHRDVSTNNILIKSDGHVCLADFGVSVTGGDGRAMTPSMGTRWYMSPEILFGSTSYGTSTDIWSAGCILVELLVGKPLFPGDSDLDQICRIVETLGTPSEETWPSLVELPDWGKLSFGPQEAAPWIDIVGSGVSAEALELVQHMLWYNPESRVTAEGALKLKFFENIDARTARISEGIR